MTEPTHRAIMGSGQRWDDPPEALLFHLLTTVESGADEFLIVERTDDPTGQTYVQVIHDNEEFTVEYRDGAPDRHFQAFETDKRRVHDVIAGWRFDRPGWREALPWQPLDLDAPG
jgi:hypothetical protein